MEEFAPTIEIIERLKDIVSPYIGNKKVTNKDIADILGITQNKLASSLHRNSPPLEEILIFCKRTGTNPFKLFFNIPNQKRRNHV